jgi:hypothetical protein
MSRRLPKNKKFQEQGILERLGFTGDINHIKILIGLAIIAPILTVIITSLLGWSVDLYNMGYYLQHISDWLIGGKVPYVDQSFDYPPLALIPMAIAFIPTYVFNNSIWFVVTFASLMILCSIVTTICVYYIGRKLYEDEQSAYFAGLLYTCGISGAYFVVTKFDAFPVCLMMLAIAYTLYSSETFFRGYLISGIGFFVKIYPAVAAPFMLLYNRQKYPLFDEIKKLTIAFIAAILVIPSFILKHDVIYKYITESLLRSDSTYVDTATYTLYTYLKPIMEFSTLSKIMYCALVLALAYLIVRAYTRECMCDRALCGYVACALMMIVFCMSYRSPEYIMWFMPLLALLVVENRKMIYAYVLLQVLTFIEFPGLFGKLWVNNKYLGELGSFNWYVMLLFYTLEFAVMGYLIYMTYRSVANEG